MALLLLPEYILHSTIEKLLKYVRTDYKTCLSNGDHEKSILYLLLGDLKIERYKLFEQAIQVFVQADSTHPREIKVDLAFNMDMDGAPTIHITCPGDSPGTNSLGIGEGDYDPIFDASIVEPGEVDSSYYQTYNRRYKAIYDLVITTDNSNEIVLIYHVLRALLTGVTTHLHENKLLNLQISGNDLTPYSEIIPKNFFVKSLRLSFEYESGTVNLFKVFSPNEINFEGTPILE